MVRYLLTRLPSAAAVLVLASILIFSVIRLVPGDPVATLAGPDATPETMAAIRSDLGLDEPVLQQYLSWVGDVLTFDLGRSYRIGGEVTSLLGDAAANTLALTGFALLLAVLLALAVSLVTVVVNRPWLDNLVAGVNTLAVAVPTFVTGLVLVLVLAVLLPVLPAGGTPPDGFVARPDIAVQYLLLPGICLALPVAASLSRFLTDALETQMQQPYVTTATALGIPRRRIVLTQALRNALPSAVTVLGLQVGVLLGGAILVEAVFAWPGLGQLVERAISSRDYPVVQVLLLVSVVLFTVTQLLSDLVHAWLDPRIRLGGEAA
jgi:peptide/nickel transport system permease protein